MAPERGRQPGAPAQLRFDARTWFGDGEARLAGVMKGAAPRYIGSGCYI